MQNLIYTLHGKSFSLTTTQAPNSQFYKGSIHKLCPTGSAGEGKGVAHLNLKKRSSCA